jgi:hypothetical protein
MFGLKMFKKKILATLNDEFEAAIRFLQFYLILMRVPMIRRLKLILKR